LRDGARRGRKARHTGEGYNGLGRDERRGVSETMTYTVPAIHCAHCAASIREEVSEVEGVEGVDVDLEAKLVTVQGDGLDDAALRAAIEEAGYEAA
jgi:copper chaperone CopZ